MNFTISSLFTAALLLTLAIALVPRAAAAERLTWTDLLGRSDAWYASEDGRQVARNVLSHQTPRGDWPKNTDTVSAPYDGSGSPRRGTFDNGATVNEIRFLARMGRLTGESVHRTAAVRGVAHILAAQYENGGWPQTFPLGSGYDRHITFNDGTMVHLLELLREVRREEDFGWMDDALRQEAKSAFARGIECIVRCQIRVGGRLTVWCAQHDEITLEPRPARSYELVSLSGGESAGILIFLMSLEDPSPAVEAAIRAGVAWYDEVKIEGLRVVRQDGDRVVEEDASAPPVWARFYEVDTFRPFFAGRDGVVKYSLAEIEQERRTGYAWYGSWGERVAREYRRWSAAR